MAKGYALVTPELVELLPTVLPTGVTVGEKFKHGGAMRVELTGKHITKGQGYQLVVTKDPYGTYFELVENPVQEDQALNG